MLRSAIGRHLVWVASLIGAALVVSVGCNRPNGAIAAQPTPEELPVLQKTEPAIAVTVVVEGRPDLPRYPLVANLEPPKLTVAEEEALGKKQVHFKFLQYNELWCTTGSLVGPWYGGVLTANGAYAKVSVVGGSPGRLTGVGGWGGASTGTDPIGAVVSGTYSAGRGVTSAGPSSEVEVATDPTASKVARRREYRER